MSDPPDSEQPPIPLCDGWWKSFADRWTSEKGRIDTTQTETWLSIPTTPLLTTPPDCLPPVSEIVHVNAALMSGRDDPPISTEDLFRRFIASPMVPTDDFMVSVLRSPAAVGQHNSFEFNRGALSSGFEWSTDWGLSVTLVFCIPVTQIILVITDTSNVDETIVLSWRKEDVVQFTEFQTGEPGPLVHRNILYTQFKRILRLTPDTVSEDGVPPTVAMMTAFRNIVRAAPRFCPAVAVKEMPPFLLRHSLSITPSDLYYLLIHPKPDPDAAILNKLAAGIIEIAPGSEATEGRRTHPAYGWTANTSDSGGLVLTSFARSNQLAEQIKLTVGLKSNDWTFQSYDPSHNYRRTSKQKWSSSTKHLSDLSSPDWDTKFAVSCCAVVFGEQFANSKGTGLTAGALALLQFRVLVNLIQLDQCDRQPISMRMRGLLPTDIHGDEVPTDEDLGPPPYTGPPYTGDQPVK
jgi:hypothetical protein